MLMDVAKFRAWNVVLLSTAMCLAACLTASADEPSVVKPAEASAERKTAMADAPPPSEAEQITRLQRMIAADEKQLADLKAELNNPEGEYRKAESEFKAINERLLAEKAEIARKKEEKEEVGLTRLEAALAETEKNWKLARERFDLAIQTRKTSQDQASAIEAKVVQNKAALEKLVGTRPAVAPVEPPASASQAVAPPPATPSAEKPAAPAAEVAPASPAITGTPSLPTAAPAQPSALGAPGGQATFFGGPSAGDQARERANKDLEKAEQQAQAKQQAADEALKAAKSLSERLATLDRDIEFEKKMLASARKKAELAIETRAVHERDYHRVADEGGLEEIQAARARREESSQAVITAQAEVTSRMERLQELQSDRASLQKEEFAAVAAANARQIESLRAHEKVTSLKNPFAVHNILQWMLDHGPRLTLIIAAMFALRVLIKVAMKRVVDMMMQRGFRGTYEESEDRAKTLVGVFQNAASTTVIAGGTLMIFEEAGIAVAPLMGGAAVIGLAVAFGAQNLIRDYFYGFVILLENQYKLNDVLKIGEVSGQVERITLRMTVLRDIHGSVHFIPNGKIECVTNMTHGWSRAVFEIQVSYDEDTDRVVEALLGVARTLKADPQYSRIILEDAEMLGVDAFGDSAVTIKFFMKTKPLKQWTVKREMLRRIKKRFAELNIEIPYPQRVVHHRGEVSPQAIHEAGKAA
jgi:moderate conductance mechanosensitive channel